MSRFCFLALLSSCGFSLFGQQDTLQLSGTYDGRILYFQNPETDDDGVFSTISFWMNGQRYPDDSLNQAAYRIIPAAVGIRKGDSLDIRIVYHSGTKPRLISPFGPPPIRLKISNPEMDSMGNLCWEVQGTEEITCFKVQRFQWNKWVNLGKSCTIFGDTTYCHQVYPLRGENLLRIVSEDGPTVYSSNTIRFDSNVSEITYSFDKRSKRLTFSDYTLFELYDAHGILLEDNFLKEWSMEGMPKGKYYVNYGSKMIVLSLK